MGASKSQKWRKIFMTNFRKTDLNWTVILTPDKTNKNSIVNYFYYYESIHYRPRENAL